MKKLISALPVIFLTLGGAGLALGAGLIFAPAGVITLGAQLIAVGVLMIRGGGGESDDEA